MTSDKSAPSAVETRPLRLARSSSPFIRTSETTRSIMLDVLIALAPALIWSVYVNGFRALSHVLVSALSCVLLEAAYELIMRRPVTALDCSAVVTGVLIAFCLPASAPLWLPVVGSFFAIIIVKQLFGGIGHNIVNPALAAMIFLRSIAPEATVYLNPFERLSPSQIAAEYDIDAIASATPMARINAGWNPDESLLEMLLGIRAGTIGEISIILLLAGGIYLLVRRVISWHIPVTFIATVVVLNLVTNHVGNVIDYTMFQIMGGGLILGAFFMATDYTTSPSSSYGKLLYGIGCGLITYFIRKWGIFADGTAYAILTMNLLVWWLDRMSRQKPYGYTSTPAKEREAERTDE